MKRVNIKIVIKILKNVLAMGKKHMTKSRRRHFGPEIVKQSSYDGELRPDTRPLVTSIDKILSDFFFTICNRLLLGDFASSQGIVSPFSVYEKKSCFFSLSLSLCSHTLWSET